MLKTLPIIPSSTCQKIIHYSYFIPVSLPNTPILLMFQPGTTVTLGGTAS